MDHPFSTSDSLEEEHINVQHTWRKSNKLSASSSLDSAGSSDYPPPSPNIDPDSGSDDEFYNAIFAEESSSQNPFIGHEVQVSTYIKIYCTPV